MEIQNDSPGIVVFKLLDVPQIDSGMWREVSYGRVKLKIISPNLGSFFIAASASSRNINRDAYIKSWTPPFSANSWIAEKVEGEIRFTNPVIPYLLVPALSSVSRLIRLMGESVDSDTCKHLTPSEIDLLLKIKFICTEEERNSYLNSPKVWSHREANIALTMHAGLHDIRVGGSFRGSENDIGEVHVSPAGDVIPLPKVKESLYDKNFASNSFLEIQLNRRSTRAFGKPLEEVDIAKFLWLVFRDIGYISKDAKGNIPYDSVRKPYPSGGGMGDIECYLLLDDHSCIKAGVYRYLADRHALEHCRPYGGAAKKVLLASLKAIGSNKGNPLVVILTSRVSRIRWKYEGMAFALALKNAGVVIDHIYFAGSSLNLGVCAVGSGDALEYGASIGKSPWEEPVVGVLVIGNKGK